MSEQAATIFTFPVSESEPKHRLSYNCANPQEFKENLWKIIKSLELNGYALVEAWDNSVETLKEISSFFGDLQSHVRADAEGIVEVRPGANKSKDQNIDTKQYLGTSSGCMRPHTDGSYLDGLCREGKNIVRVGPPKLILLQCVVPSTSGGVNTLIDGQEVLQDLVRHDPFHARILLRDGALTFCRDDQIAMDFPMFQQVKSEIHQVRFRFDEMLYAQHWSYLSVMHVYTHYLANPKYIKRLELQEKQILIIDNTRMLHGRDAIGESPENQRRFLRRIWIRDAYHSILVNAVDEKTSHRAFAAYDDYRRVDSGQRKPWVEDMNLGIRLSAELQRMSDHLDKQAI